MHVPVARVENVAHLQAIAFRHLADPPQHHGQGRNRDRPIEAHVIVDLPHGAESGLPAKPDLGALLR